MTTGKVLVLGREDRAFLAVIRSLGRRGLEVHVTWVPEDSLALRSRYVARVHRLPVYTPGDDAWKTAFVALCDRERFDLVVPTNDASIMPLQTHRAELEPHARIYLLNARSFDICFDKAKTYTLAEELGVRVPRQMVLPLPAAPGAVADDWFPLVLKPYASFTLANLTSKHFVRRARNAAELARELQHFGCDAQVLVQEAFEGTGAGIEGLAWRGEFLSAFHHLRIHERRKGGADSYRGSRPLHPELYDAAAKMVRALDYSGVVMFEFKLHLETGAWVLLEINARFWASLPLAVLAGADYPWWLYQLLVEGRTDFPRDYRTDVFCRNWGRDLIWLKENFQAPAAERYPWGKVVRELAPALLGRESSDTFVTDDPAPGLEDLRRFAVRGLRKVRRFGREAAWTAPPVRWMAARRARRALHDARRVLFVCKGNICRSPFAEAYARHMLDDGAEVLSAGYYPKADRRCPVPAVEAARELGIDLGAHRSTVLSAELVRDADAIFTFDQENLERVRSGFPEARGRLHRVAALGGGGPTEILDPYGGSVADFRRAYARIKAAMDAAR